MKSHAQGLDRADVAPTEPTVLPAELARLPEPLQEEIRRRPIVQIAEMAVLLETSPRTILRQLRAGTFFIDEAPQVDRRHRWSRARVYLAIAGTTRLSHATRVVRQLRAVPRKPQSEAAREGGRS